MREVCDDLEDEQESLHKLLEDLEERCWDTPTPAAGWNVRDQVGHLGHGEELAALAASDPAGFQRELEALMGDVGGRIAAVQARARASHGPGLLHSWRTASNRTLEELRRRGARERIAWAGPSMSARSFASARLMETFAHGQDIRDALGAPPPATPRLRHVAELGVRTRAFAYTLRGEPAPETALRVELAAPGGGTWAWGEADAPDRVSGPALDFCLVVTRRRHPADTRLVAHGPTASGWLAIAQCYLGPPDEGRPAGAFPPPEG